MSEPASEDRVFLAIPHYGEILPETLAAVCSCTQRRPPQIVTNGASLLAHNFNKLWCNALNDRKKNGLTHFAMLHADVMPDPLWLDTLIDEMRRVGADVISCVVAIKDPRGLTSTGYQHPGTNNITRFTMAEVMALPETFDASACPVASSILMVNSAVWVCDFTKPWVEDVCFNIRDKIAKTDLGEFVPMVLSEDWNFSGWCAEKGLKVFATRKVSVAHYGRIAFTTNKVWGELVTDVGDRPILREKPELNNGRCENHETAAASNGQRAGTSLPGAGGLPDQQGLEADRRPVLSGHAVD